MKTVECISSAASNGAVPDLECDDERELIIALRARDERAYEKLVRDHGPAMLATARKYLPQGHDSEDAVQDALLSAFRCIESFNCDSRLATWLHRIVVNACLMKLRAGGRSSRLNIREDLSKLGFSGRSHRQLTDHDSVRTGVALNELKMYVRQCIDRLPPAYREVLMLRDIKELDTSETARVLNTSMANVKTRLHRARQVLRALLGPAPASTESWLPCA